MLQAPRFSRRFYAGQWAARRAGPRPHREGQRESTCRSRRPPTMKIKPRDAAAVSIGIELVVSVMLGLGGGYWLDKKLHTSPWFTLVGIVLGFAAGLRSLIGMMRRASHEDRESPPPG